MGKLNQILQEVVYKVSIAKNLPEAIAREANGQIYTFGSYRLGVHTAGADIDALCVVPKHIQRSDFFSGFYDKLKSSREVTDIGKVEIAYVPIIKLEFSGIQVDLAFASLAIPAIPPDLNLLDNSLLRNIDEKCIRSLNGCRVTDEILQLVPNVFNYRSALRCIKLWAKRKGIYSNIIGFFGGVSWAMCVARVAQMYPYATATRLVEKFFLVMHKWKWPQPVLLKEIEEDPLGMKTWNPKTNFMDRTHKMPVITPAYPSMCSTHNVSQSTMDIMIMEFSRATKIIEEIKERKAEWSKLFEKSDFFMRYKGYIQVITISNSTLLQDEWGGCLFSKLRNLVGKLEYIEEIKTIHPYQEPVEDKYENLSEVEYKYMLIYGKDRHKSPKEMNEEIIGFLKPFLGEKEAEVDNDSDSSNSSQNGGPKRAYLSQMMNMEGMESDLFDEIKRKDRPEVQKNENGKDADEKIDTTSLFSTSFYIGLDYSFKEICEKQMEKLKTQTNGSTKNETETPEKKKLVLQNKIDLSVLVAEFINSMITTTDFDNTKMGVNCYFLKQTQLPKTVFDEKQNQLVQEKTQRLEKKRKRAKSKEANDKESLTIPSQEPKSIPSIEADQENIIEKNEELRIQPTN